MLELGLSLANGHLSSGRFEKIFGNIFLKQISSKNPNPKQLRNKNIWNVGNVGLRSWARPSTTPTSGQKEPEGGQTWQKEQTMVSPSMLVMMMTTMMTTTMMTMMPIPYVIFRSHSGLGEPVCAQLWKDWWRQGSSFCHNNLQKFNKLWAESFRIFGILFNDVKKSHLKRSTDNRMKYSNFNKKNQIEKVYRYQDEIFK